MSHTSLQFKNEQKQSPQKIKRITTVQKMSRREVWGFA